MKETKNKLIEWPDKLRELDNLLKKGGLTVSIDIWLRIHDLLIAKYQQQRPIYPEGLKWSLCGLITTNKEQQQKFIIIYEEWLDAINNSENINQATPVTIKKTTKQHRKSNNPRKENQSVWKKILTIIVFTILLVTTYLLPSDNTKETIIYSPPITQPVETSVDSNIKKINPIAPSLPFLLIGFIGLFGLIQWIQGKKVLQQQKGNLRDPLIHTNINNNSLGSKLFNSPDLLHALRGMHNPISRLNYRLAIDKTADATAKAAGYFTPVYQQQAIIPPCILMIGYQHGQDQATGLALLLQQRLTHAGLEVYTFFFQGTPQKLKPIGENYWTTLEQVTHKYTPAKLLLISDPDIFFSSWSGERHSWVNTFRLWNQCALLYKRPITDNKLNKLARLNIHCSPLSSEGLTQISHWFSDPYFKLDLKQPKLQILPAALARLTDSDCYETPNTSSKKELIEALNEFCNTSDLRLLTIISTYPELHWGLTQRLEKECFFENNTLEERENRLLKLLRLPWLRYGQIPEWLREHLVSNQSKTLRKETQNLYLDLFREAQILARTKADESIEYPFRAEDKEAYIKWLNKIRKVSLIFSKDNIWQDQIFTETLTGTNNLDYLDHLLPNKLAKFLSKRRWLYIFSRLTIVPIFFWIILSVFYQNITGKQVTVQSNIPTDKNSNETLPIKSEEKKPLSPEAVPTVESTAKSKPSESISTGTKLDNKNSSNTNLGSSSPYIVAARQDSKLSSKKHKNDKSRAKSSMKGRGSRLNPPKPNSPWPNLSQYPKFSSEENKAIKLLTPLPRKEQGSPKPNASRPNTPKPIVPIVNSPKSNPKRTITKIGRNQNQSTMKDKYIKGSPPQNPANGTAPHTHKKIPKCTNSSKHTHAFTDPNHRHIHNCKE